MGGERLNRSGGTAAGRFSLILSDDRGGRRVPLEPGGGVNPPRSSSAGRWTRYWPRRGTRRI